MPIAREVFPDLDTDDLISILWNRTGYPQFWLRDPVAELRQQLTDFRNTGGQHEPETISATNH